uniref:Uncharacterized protein n=1 Tax=Candidatus Kentrum sp. LFY TaxID=2126342 RepID=A0A450UN46_9GAMM|nr:MAG: hypothetical protein BECKLFY1418A_GA0070994_103536 [Candidatus Kentron sp. LFY]
MPIMHATVIDDRHIELSAPLGISPGSNVVVSIQNHRKAIPIMSRGRTHRWSDFPLPTENRNRSMVPSLRSHPSSSLGTRFQKLRLLS